MSRKFLFVLLGLALVLNLFMPLPGASVRAESASFNAGGYPSVDKTGGVWHFQFAADKWQAFSVPIKEGLTYNFIKNYCSSLISAYGMHDGGGYYSLASGDTLEPGNGYWIKFDSDCPLNFSGTDYNYSPKTLAPNVSYFIGAEGKSNVLDNKKGTCDNLELLTLGANGSYILSPDDLLVNGFAYWLKNTGSQSCTFASSTSDKPDLTITDVEFSAEPKVGDHYLGGQVTIKNIGTTKVQFRTNNIINGSLKPYGLVSVYLNGLPGGANSTQVARSGIGAVTSGDGSTIAPGESKQYIFSTMQDENIRAELLGSAGQKNLYFIVDEDNEVVESNENNNTLTKTVVVADQKPDLIIQDIYLENNLVKVGYCNIGNTQPLVSGFPATFYIKVTANGKTHTGTSDNTNYVVQVPGPGNCQTLSDYPVAYFNLTAGQSYSITAEADWQKSIAESNENNNNLTKIVTITDSSAKPDLTVESIEFFKKWSAWENVLVAEVCNRGTAPKPAGIQMHTEFSINGQSTRHGSSDIIGIGQCVTPFTLLSNFTNLTAGNYNVKVEADKDSFSNTYNNVINESNENNNSLTKSIYLDIASPACTDSDGGKNYYQKGICQSWVDNYQKHEEFCLNSQLLMENFPAADNNGKLVCGSEVYTCPNGCQDGACIKAPTTPSITVLSPNGEEKWEIGKTHEIKWTSSNLPTGAKVEIGIAPHGTNNYSTIFSNINSSLGKINWTVNSPQGLYSIYVIYPSYGNPIVSDISDAPFSIVSAPTTPSITVLSPNGEEKWEVGKTYEIKWTSAGVDKVDISLCGQIPIDTPGSCLPLIADDVSANLGRYSWTIPSNILAGDNYKIRVFYNKSMADDSNDFFSITSTAPVCATGKTTIVHEQPLNGYVYQALGLDISAHPEILKYRIRWFNGNWSPWYVPGTNDIDWKTNTDGTARRVWAYFDDHVHEYEKCVQGEQKPDLTLKDIFYENGLIKVKYCNEGIGESGAMEIFYLKMTANGQTHTGKSGGTDYGFLVPAPGICKNTDGYPLSYFNLSNTSGGIEVKAEIDWEKNIDESNENNNSLVKTVAIVDSAKQHDFVVKDIEFYFLPQVGNNLTLRVKFDDLFESTDNLIDYEFTIDAPDAIIGASIMSEPHDRAQIWRTVKYTTPGKHTLTVTVDPYDKIQETDESNNSKSQSIEIVDVSAQPKILSNSVNDITSTSARIIFETDVDSQGEVWYKAATEQDYENYIKEDYYTKNHSIILGNLKPGTKYYYFIFAMDKNNISSSQTSANTFTTLSESNQLKPDLVPIQLEVKNLTHPGNKVFKQNDIVEVKISFKNNGPADIHQEFFYTVEKDIGFGRLRGNVLDLKADETYKYTSKMLWPKDIISGEVNFMFTVDSGNNIDESNEDNNILFKKIILGNATPIPTPTPPPTPTPSPIPSPPSSEIAHRLAGRLLLAVEDKGRIHYVNPDDLKKYEVTFGNVMSLFQNLALGISNADLNQILINPSSVSEDKDTDRDGFNDKSEVMYGYNPEIASSAANRGNDKIKVNTKLSNRLIGKLLLQTEDRGRIWYVDQGAKRWEVTFGNVINLFTSLALGITNQDLSEITAGN